MSTRRFLIAYDTHDGQTARIARRVADRLTFGGDDVTLVHVAELRRQRELPHGLTLRDFHAVVVGAPVRYGRHPRSVRRFVRRHRDGLNAMPTALFSVSGAASSQMPEAQAEARRRVEDFLADTGWRPRVVEPIAGALRYTQYGRLQRWLLRRSTAKHGGPVDVTRDHELTDWTQVERFTRTLAAMVPRGPHSAAGLGLRSGSLPS